MSAPIQLIRTTCLICSARLPNSLQNARWPFSIGSREAEYKELTPSRAASHVALSFRSNLTTSCAPKARSESAFSMLKQQARTVNVPSCASCATSSLPIRPEADVMSTIGFGMNGSCKGRALRTS